MLFNILHPRGEGIRKPRGPPKPRGAEGSTLQPLQLLGAHREACACRKRAPSQQVWVQQLLLAEVSGLSSLLWSCSEESSTSLFHSSMHWPSCPASHHPFLVMLEPEPNRAIVEAPGLGLFPGVGPGLTRRTEVWAPIWNTEGFDSKLPESRACMFIPEALNCLTLTGISRSTFEMSDRRKTITVIENVWLKN